MVDRKERRRRHGETIFNATIKEKYESEEQLSISEIAKLIDRSPSYVRRRLIDMGVSMRPRGSTRGQQRIKGIDGKIEELWLAGVQIQHIAKKVYVSPHLVGRRLRSMGYDTRRPFYEIEFIDHQQIDQVVFMYEQLKMTSPEICKHFGWNSNTSVWRRLDKAGVKRRSRSEASTLVHQRKKLEQPRPLTPTR